MTTIASDPQIALREPASLPALRIADQGVASALESLLFGNTRRVYGVQWRLFNDWCDLVGLRALPAEPLTVARYLAARAGAGASIAPYSWPPPPSPKPTSGPAWNRPAGTRACALLQKDAEGGWPGPSARPAPSPPTCSP